MSEWEEKLNTLLSDPDAMAQVMQMAQSLSQQMGQPAARRRLHQTVQQLRRLRPRRRKDRRTLLPRCPAASIPRLFKSSCRCSRSSIGPRAAKPPPFCARCGRF